MVVGFVEPLGWAMLQGLLEGEADGGDDSAEFFPERLIGVGDCSLVLLGGAIGPGHEQDGAAAVLADFFVELGGVEVEEGRVQEGQLALFLENDVIPVLGLDEFQGGAALPVALEG